jgi:putative membrane protein
MFIQSLIISSAMLAAPQAQTPPRATPETPRPAADTQTPKADEAHKAHAVPAADAAFLKKIANGGVSEVEIAKLAQQKAENGDVKDFADTLVKDHSNVNEEITALAQKTQVTLTPSTTPSPVFTKLEKLSGAAFDRAFVAAMVDDHVKDVKAFEKVASGSGHADIKAFAAKVLPTLKEHLAKVQTLSKQIGKKPMS